MRPDADTTTYFDLQVNGYAGIDFNGDDLVPEALHQACAALRHDGVSGILATVVTEEVGLMCRRLRRIAELREKDPLVEQVVRGLHVEGPFVNEAAGYRGAHPPDSIRPADPDTMRRLLDAGSGLVRLVTLAPERDAGLTVTNWLVDRKIVVAAGHTNASLDELTAAADAGLSLFTHAGNGCPMEMHRHDNIIQRAISLAGRISLTLIADGVHIPFFALKNLIRLAGIENCLIVTDAMAAAGMGPGLYRLARWELRVDENMVARSPDNSHLVGSAMTMRRAAENLREKLGLTTDQIRRLTAVNPRKAIGMEEV